MIARYEDPSSWRQERRGQLRAGLTLGFVPTMGALHEGHLTLVRRSVKENDRTLVSIFVNPTQFDDPGDLARYPRTLERDLELLAAEGDISVLLPTQARLYPDAYRYRVVETELTRVLEGAHRNGHFDGVLTVVMKLLQIAGADRAYFGEKDWQQLRLVQGMAAAFFLPTAIVPCETVREGDGLALSSRNTRLSAAARQVAPQLYRTLRSAATAADAAEALQREGFEVDYVDDREGYRLAAARLDGVRLIDNVQDRRPVVTLVLDVGNSQIFGGLFDQGRLTLRFRQPSRVPTTSDELGLFLRSVLRENGGDPASVQQVALCSVVPEIVYSLRSCSRKYFGVDPFVLQAGTKTGLKIRYRNPLEVGPDRIANAIAGTHLYPDRHLIIIDFGTATTFDVVRAGREYLGGIILPGLRMQMEALERNTARLPNVEILTPAELVGRSTIECIQSGLYFGNRAAVIELTREIRQRTFGDEPTVVIATGGFSRLFERERVFDVVQPDLVLIGLNHALSLNPGASRPWQMAASEVTS